MVYLSLKIGTTTFLAVPSLGFVNQRVCTFHSRSLKCKLVHVWCCVRTGPLMPEYMSLEIKDFQIGKGLRDRFSGLAAQFLKQ